MHRTVLWTLGVGLLAGAVFGTPSYAATPAEGPPLAQLADCHDCNLVVIVIDTLRAKSTTPYGYDRDTTPAMAAAAHLGVQFQKGYSPATWTIPSVGSMLSLGTVLDTGLTFSWDPTFESWHPWKDSVTPIAQVMHDQGIETHAYIQTDAIHDDLGFKKGFDDWQRFWNKAPPFDAVVADLQKRQTDGRRFFDYVHLRGVHVPLLPPEEYRSLFTEGGKALPYTASGYGYVDARRDATGMKQFITAYDQAGRWYDDGIKQVLAELVRSGLMKKTYVIITADHGESLGENGRLGHGGHAYEERTHVPLILWGGTAPQGASVDAPVNVLDVIQTVLERMGIQDKPSYGWRGVDLEKTRPEFVVTQSIDKGTPPDKQEIVLRHAGGVEAVVSVDGTRKELYRVPDEDTPVAIDPVGKALLDKAAALASGIVADAAAKGPQNQAKIKFTKEQIDALRALGYVE